jgi:pSer/pThr/pTyr-binding forkhead associated (FHA) protein
MNKSLNVNITSELKNPTTAGTHYRFLCMTGPNKGNAYYLTGKRIIIGRGANADIVIIDPKISREHAELSFSGNGYTVTDLGAQNGILVNDNKVKQKKLADNEKVVIGQTVFKYNIIEVALNSELEVYSEESAELETKISKVGKTKTTLKSNYAGAESFSSKKSNPPAQKGNSKILIMGAIVAIVLYVLMGKDEPVKTSKVHNDNTTGDFDNKDLTPPKVTADDAVAKKKLESYIHSGRREFSEGNYFRAMEDFRLALLLSPNNGHASFYLAKAKQRLDEDIDKNFLKAKQEYEAKKLLASIVSYCGVVQLIQNYPDDDRYKNAMLKISAIEAELGMEKGEAKCFEEKSADSKN